MRFFSLLLCGEARTNSNRRLISSPLSRVRVRCTESLQIRWKTRAKTVDLDLLKSEHKDPPLTLATGPDRRWFDPVPLKPLEPTQANVPFVTGADPSAIVALFWVTSSINRSLSL